jgi:uncharacterized protein
MVEIKADYDQIEEVAREIGDASDAQAVVLFGSYARGDWGKSSDVDLFVIAKTELPYFKRTRGLSNILRKYSFPVDLLVYTPQEYEQCKRDKYSVANCVSQEGKVLYGRL